MINIEITLILKAKELRLSNNEFKNTIDALNFIDNILNQQEVKGMYIKLTKK